MGLKTYPSQTIEFLERNRTVYQNAFKGGNFINGTVIAARTVLRSDLNLLDSLDSTDWRSHAQRDITDFGGLIFQVIHEANQLFKKAANPFGQLWNRYTNPAESRRNNDHPFVDNATQAFLVRQLLLARYGLRSNQVQWSAVDNNRLYTDMDVKIHIFNSHAIIIDPDLVSNPLIVASLTLSN